MTAGASAPDVLVRSVIARIGELGASSVQELDGVEEHVRFSLPPGLRERGEEGKIQQAKCACRSLLLSKKSCVLHAMAAVSHCCAVARMASYIM